MEYNFKICEPHIKELNTKIILISWKNPPIRFVRAADSRFSGPYPDNFEYVIQWPWRWFYRWRIEQTKKKLIKRYLNWKHGTLLNRRDYVEWTEKVNSRDKVRGHGS